MTRPAVLALLAVAGCAAPRPVQPPAGREAVGFDAAAWLARARPLAVPNVSETEFDDPRVLPAHALAAELDAATGWARACDTYWDPDRQRLVTDDASAGDTRGLFAIHDADPGEAVVAVTCDVGAYQGSYALVRIADGRAALLAGQPVSTDGAPFGPPVAVYATPTFDAGGRTFTTLALARGIGGCGVLSSYEITGPATVALVEARAAECGTDAPSEPSLWPVVFPRR